MSEPTVVKSAIVGATIRFNWLNDDTFYTAVVQSRNGDILCISYLDENGELGEPDELELTSLVCVEVLPQMTDGYSDPSIDLAEDLPQLSTCILCCAEREYFSVSPCGHTVCGRCTVKLRWDFKRFYKKRHDPPDLKLKCPVCREPWSNCLIAKGVGHTWDEFDVNNGMCFDSEIQVYFTNFMDRKRFVCMRKLFCPECDKDANRKMSKPDYLQFRMKSKWFSHAKQLGQHLRKEHRKHICTVCLDNNRMFIDEMKIFESKHQLFKHKKKNRIHPECSFCKEYFFDSDKFLQHMQDKHYSCPWCDGTEIVFYEQQDAIKDHYRRKHFICELEDCAQFIMAFENVLDYNSHRRNCHKEKLSKAELSGKINLEDFYGRSRADQPSPEAKSIVYQVPNARSGRETDFEIRRKQEEHWERQKRIEENRYNRQLREVIGDRRLRCIPDAVKPEEIFEKKLKLHDLLQKTIKKSAKREYHHKIYNEYERNGLSPRRFFKSFRMLWNPGNDIDVWVEALMVIIGVDPNAEKRRELYECYKSWMQDRHSDDDVRIWYFPEFTELCHEMSDFTLLQLQIDRIREGDCPFPTLANKTKNSGKWMNKRDPSKVGWGKKQPTGYAGRVHRANFRANNTNTIKKKKPKRVRLDVMPGLPAPQVRQPNSTQRRKNVTSQQQHPTVRSNRNHVPKPFTTVRSNRNPVPKPFPKPFPNTQNVQPQHRPKISTTRAPPPTKPAARPSTKLEKMKKPGVRKLEKPKKKKKQEDSPTGGSSRVIHESAKPKSAQDAVEDLRNKFYDLDLTGSHNNDKWDGLLQKLCSTLLKILGSRSHANNVLCLTQDSVNLEKLAKRILNRNNNLDSCMEKSFLIQFFGKDVATRLAGIQSELRVNPYDGEWVEQLLTHVDVNTLYTYAYFVYHYRNQWTVLSEQQPANKPTKRKKKKKKERVLKLGRR